MQQVDNVLCNYIIEIYQIKVVSEYKIFIYNHCKTKLRLVLFKIKSL